MLHIPELDLNDGRRIPQLGFGVWQLPEDRAPEIVGHALRSGYRHIDTAHAYGNEAGIGRAVREADIPREDIFVTTKLWNMFHGRDATLEAFDGSMERLGLDYVDLYLIHWPVPMEDKYVDTWRAMIELRDAGRIRSIGVSNAYVSLQGFRDHRPHALPRSLRSLRPQRLAGRALRGTGGF